MLLDKYINKRKKQHLLINCLLAAFILFILLVPDMAYEIVSGIFSFLFDNAIGLLHMLYEVIEYGIDLIVESILDTGLHTTQTISFYIQIILATILSYFVIRLIYSTIKKLLFCCHLCYCRKKASLVYYWGEQSLLHKTGIISSAIMLISCYLLFFI